MNPVFYPLGRLTDQLKELQTTKAHVAEPEKKVTNEHKQAFAALPAQYGFADMTSFIRALRETASRKRVRISDTQRSEVKQLLAVGQTGAENSALTAARGTARL